MVPVPHLPRAGGVLLVPCGRLSGGLPLSVLLPSHPSPQPFTGSESEFLGQLCRALPEPAVLQPGGTQDHGQRPAPQLAPPHSHHVSVGSSATSRTWEGGHPARCCPS